MSNADQFDDFENDRESSRPVKKKGMSTGAKVAIVLGIVVGVAMLACCGVGGYFMNKVRQSVTTDPAQVATIQQSILTNIDLPADYSGKMGMDLTLAGQGMKMVVFGKGAGPEPQGSSMLMLMQMPVAANEDQMRGEMEKNMGREGNIQVESSEVKTVTLDGAEAKFNFAKGKQEDGSEVRQITGVFPGKSGSVMLMHIVPEAEYDEAQVLKMLESIKK